MEQMKKQITLLLVAALLISFTNYAQQAPKPTRVSSQELLADLEIVSVTVSANITDHRNGQERKFRKITYTIKNVGRRKADLNLISMQGYAGSDDVFVISNMSVACGALARQGSGNYILPGATYTGSFSCDETGNWNLQTFYLLVVDKHNKVKESNEKNNELVTTIPN
jgi:predicted molibdopterin-dependent oxidoreductase YjgC